MGGNGARSAGSRIWGAGGMAAFGLGTNPTRNNNPNPVQQSATNGQPTQPSMTLQQFQAMNDKEVVNYLNNLSKNVVMPPMAELPDCDTQRIVYDLDLNTAPRVVSDSQFRKESGETVYRGVHDFKDNHGTILATADSIVNDTLYSPTSRIGAGVAGDGFYFGRRNTAEMYAGRGGRVMRMKLDKSKARTIELNNLQNMFSREPRAVRDAFSRMSTVGNEWSSGYLSSYALYKGYNVITRYAVGHVIPIDRSVMIMSDVAYQL